MAGDRVAATGELDARYSLRPPCLKCEMCRSALCVCLKQSFLTALTDYTPPAGHGFFELVVKYLLSVVVLFDNPYHHPQ